MPLARPKDRVLDWPRLSIVTPSFNQATFLERTIKSVIEQQYPSLEFIIIDGESTDGSVGIIQKYSSHLSHWISEADSGQSQAINKGFAKATGDIVCWLNSDDVLTPGALYVVGEYFALNPSWKWIVGQCVTIDDFDRVLKRISARYRGRESLMRFWEAWSGGTMLPQPSSFWRRECARTIFLNEDLHYSMDYEFWLRLSETMEPTIIPETLACYRYHDASKTARAEARFLEEQLRSARPHWRRQGLAFWASCEIAWRRLRAEKNFADAFDLKRRGARLASAQRLIDSLAYDPFTLARWRTLNLLARLLLGDEKVDRMRDFVAPIRSGLSGRRR